MYLKIARTSLILLLCISKAGMAMEQKRTEGITAEEHTQLIKGVEPLRPVTEQEKSQLIKLIKAYNVPMAGAQAILSKETAPFLGQNWADTLVQFGKNIFDTAVAVQIASLLGQAQDYAQKTIKTINKNAQALIEENPVRAEVIKTNLPSQITETLKEELKKTPLFSEANDLHVALFGRADPEIDKYFQAKIQAPSLVNESAAGEDLPITPLFLAEYIGNEKAKEMLIARGATQPTEKLIKELLTAAEDARKPQAKWEPSLQFRALMRRNPKAYKDPIEHTLKHVQSNPQYKEQLRSEDPQFLDWLMKQPH